MKYYSIFYGELKMITPIRKICLFILFAFIFAFSACSSTSMPIKEMVRAKETITQAEEVNAETYSKENLDKAVSHLTASHGQSLNKKDKDAKESANKARDAAQKAIDESLPLLAADALENAKSSAQTAKNLNAEEYAKADYSAALKSLEEAEKLNSEQNYRDSFAASNQSIESSEKAIEASKTRIPTVKKSIDDAAARRNDLAKRSQNPEVQTILRTAQGNIDSANSSLNNENLVAANKSVKDANTNLTRAQLIIDVDNKMKEVDALKAQAADLRKSDTHGFATAELSAANSSLDRATTAARNRDLKQTTDNAAAASKSIADARQKITAGQAAAKKLTDVKTAADNLFQQLPKDDKQFDNQVAQIKAQLAKGDDALAKKDTPNVLASANDAEKSVNALRAAHTAHVAAQAKAAAEAKAKADAEAKAAAEAKAKAEAQAKAEAEAKAKAEAQAKAEEELRVATAAAAAKEAEKKSGTGAAGAGRGETGDGAIYVVRYTPPNHDSLWQISWKLYKDATLWPLIFMENKDQIKDPDLIFPGQRFVIPALDDDMRVNREAARRIRNQNLGNR